MARAEKFVGLYETLYSALNSPAGTELARAVLQDWVEMSARTGGDELVALWSDRLQWDRSRGADGFTWHVEPDVAAAWWLDQLHRWGVRRDDRATLVATRTERAAYAVVDVPDGAPATVRNPCWYLDDTVIERGMATNIPPEGRI